MAVPSYLAVTAFEPFLPVGFGIAAGAMIWMVFAELTPDANKNASSNTVGITVMLAFAFMIAFQYLVLGRVKTHSGRKRFGSLADIAASLSDVRFTPESGHSAVARPTHCVG
jgi:hypothetical protein